MMIVKSSSTGKTKVKHTQLIRMTEYSTCPKSMQKDIHKKDYERPQPIKIAQLFGLSENGKTTEKNSVRKRIQPERLGKSSNAKSTKKSDKKNAVGTYDRSVNVLKCVRRNLNFNEFPSNSSKKNYENKNQLNTFITDDPVYKKSCDQMRKSLLLPPNTIKNKHLQKCTGKENCHSRVSEIPNETITDKKETVQKERKKMEVVSVLPPNNKSSNARNSTVPFDSMKPSSVHKIIIFSDHQNSKHVNKNHVQSDIVSNSQIPSQCTTTQKITINNKNQSVVQNSLPQKRFILNESNLKNEAATKSEDEGKCIQSLCNNLENMKLVNSNNNTNTKSASSETICINRDKIISLECDLKKLLSITEENVFKLKSTLTCITKLLSGNEEKITLSDADVERKHTELEKVNNVMVDKEVQVDTYCNLIQQSEEKLRTPVIHNPQITVTNILSVNTNQSIQNIENDKENYELIHRRRLSNGDGSFLELEDQLNIEHTKITQELIPLQKTPVVTRYKQKQSLREYMALKSTMRFLETPDIKKFKKPLHEIDNMNNSVLNATHISNKILTELHNLYYDSPESSL